MHYVILLLTEKVAKSSPVTIVFLREHISWINLRITIPLIDNNEYTSENARLLQNIR